MASLRHPNIVLFLGLCYSPPAIVTGEAAGCTGHPLAWLRGHCGAVARVHQLGQADRGTQALPSMPCCPRLHSPTPSRSRNQLPAEYCSRGSLFDCLRAASQAEGAAAQLSWTRRLNMALDAAKGVS